MSQASLLGLLGLGARAGSVIVGVAAVRSALRRNDVKLVIVANDRSDRTESKALLLAKARNVPIVVGPEAHELGRVVGRGTVQVVGICDRRLAEGMQPKTARVGL